jgi:hypothetical protein
VAVPQVDLSVGMLRYIVLVRDQHNGVVLAMQLIEQSHNFAASG